MSYKPFENFRIFKLQGISKSIWAKDFKAGQPLKLIK